MKKIYFILFTLAFILSVLPSLAQNARKLKFTELRQQAFDGNAFNSPVYLPKPPSASAVVVPGDCPAEHAFSTDEGTILCVYINDTKRTETVKTGNDDCGEWGLAAYGDCVGIWRVRYDDRKCARTDVLQDKHECSYIPHAAWIGWVGTGTLTHPHGGP